MGPRINHLMMALITLVTTVSTASAQEPAGAGKLRFELTPYVWMPTIDATVRNQTQSGATATTSLSIGVGEYLTKLNFAGMVTAGARYEQYSLFTDLVYLNANSDSTRVRSVETRLLRLPVTDTISSSTRIQSTIWSLVGGYTVADVDRVQVDIIGGVRLLALDQTVNAVLSRDVTTPSGAVALSRSSRLTASSTTLNGIAGIRGRLRLPDSSFYVPFQFDIGSGAAVWSWQAFAGLGYHTQHVDVSIGYRYLAFDQHGSSNVQNLSMGGPIVSATFAF